MKIRTIIKSVAESIGTDFGFFRQSYARHGPLFSKPAGFSNWMQWALLALFAPIYIVLILAIVVLARFQRTVLFCYNLLKEPFCKRTNIAYFLAEQKKDEPSQLSSSRDWGKPRRKSISVLLCNYNHGKYIERAIKAVVNQSRQPDEYLIMDDGSSDNSVEIISFYAAKYPFIKLFRKTKNEGYIKGIRDLTNAAKGDYIHRGASDDYMRPGFIECAMCLAERFPTAGIISGEMLNGTEEEPPKYLIEIPHWRSGFVTPRQYLHDYLEVGDPVCTLAPATIFRKAAVEEVGGWREDLGTWDVSFVMQAVSLRYGMCYLDMPCYSWFFRKRAWTFTQNRDIEFSKRICMNYYNLMVSDEFRAEFGEKFPKLWFKANMKMAFDTFVDTYLNYSKFQELKGADLIPPVRDTVQIPYLQEAS